MAEIRSSRLSKSSFGSVARPTCLGSGGGLSVKMTAPTLCTLKAAPHLLNGYLQLYLILYIVSILKMLARVIFSTNCKLIVLYLGVEHWQQLSIKCRFYNPSLQQAPLKMRG